jgi:hypothetical protein
VRARVVGNLAELLLALTALVVGHDLDFLLAYGSGYQGALARTGHDSHWETAVLTVIAAGLLLGLVATARLIWLIRFVTRVRVETSARSNLAPVPRLLAFTWARLFVVSIFLFILQENYERASVGLGLPGPSVLAPDSGVSPILVFAFVSLLVAAVAALFRWTIAALEEQLARSRSAVPPATAEPRVPRLEGVRAVSSILGRNLAGRAPPAALLR